VTVGTTNFDSLIRILDANATDFLESLRSLDVGSATIQVGATSTFWPGHLEKLPNFRVVRTLPHAEFLREVETADLILGHAGAGTILEALSNAKRLIVVPNRSLMDDHQLELCEAVADKYCLSCAESDVVEILRGAKAAFQKVTCKLPPHLSTNDFALRLDDMMRWPDPDDEMQD
jgi:beta-1,4-N-acetylglucosaminyltransferase